MLNIYVPVREAGTGGCEGAREDEGKGLSDEKRGRVSESVSMSMIESERANENE